MSITRRGFIRHFLAATGAILLGPARVLARKRKDKKKPRPEPEWLFADRFRRYDPNGWGRAWFNQRYGRHWEVRDGKGVYRLPPIEEGIKPLTYRPIPLLVLDHDVTNVDLRATVSASNTTARVGLVARALSYGDYYAAYLGSGGYLRVMRCGPHHEKKFRKRRFKWESNVPYRMRLRVSGNRSVRIKVKVWPEGTPEPARWMLDVKDDTKRALTGPGPFGLFMGHGIDGLGTSFRVRDVIAWSKEEGTSTPPSIAYSFVGPVDGATQSVRVVAKSGVPASIGFRYGPEPTLTQAVRQIAPRPTSQGAEAVSASFDLAEFAASTVVYWQAVARRRGKTVSGPVSSFRMPPAPRLPLRFAFGACTRWEPYPKVSFEQASLKVPDFFLHQGDLGYVNMNVTRSARDTYQDHWVRVLMDPALATLHRSVPCAFYQDDHDYGRDGADRETYKRFTVPAFNQLHANPSDKYFSFWSGDVAVFCLDCRRFSTGTKPPLEERSKIGAEQKTWLKESMRRAVDEQDAGLLVVASPMAFGSDTSPQSWRRRYTTEWSELMDFFQQLQAPVLIVSGDSHAQRLHEYPKVNLALDVPRVVEFVSAGTEPKTKPSPAIDADIVLRDSLHSGFGLVELGQEELVGGQRVRSLALTAVRSNDGTPLWSARYTIVRGLGIVPSI